MIHFSCESCRESVVFTHLWWIPTYCKKCNNPFQWKSHWLYGTMTWFDRLIYIFRTKIA